VVLFIFKRPTKKNMPIGKNDEQSEKTNPVAKGDPVTKFYKRGKKR